MNKYAATPKIIALCFLLTLTLCAAAVYAVPSSMKIVYSGKGAGEVVFDHIFHAQKGLTCAVCHEGSGLQPKLFEMEIGVNLISMRKIYFGRSCGYCHKLTNQDFYTCPICHRK